MYTFVEKGPRSDLKVLKAVVDNVRKVHQHNNINYVILFRPEIHQNGCKIGFADIKKG